MSFGEYKLSHMNVYTIDIHIQMECTIGNISWQTADLFSNCMYGTPCCLLTDNNHL